MQTHSRPSTALAAASHKPFELVQIFHFIPTLRRLLLQHVPDPDADHSLADEAALLERMLSGALSALCTNLLLDI